MGRQGIGRACLGLTIEFSLGTDGPEFTTWREVLPNEVRGCQRLAGPLMSVRH